LKFDVWPAKKIGQYEKLQSQEKVVGEICGEFACVALSCVGVMENHADNVDSTRMFVKTDCPLLGLAKGLVAIQVLIVSQDSVSSYCIG
jgi:hypothetical protein